MMPTPASDFAPAVLVPAVLAAVIPGASFRQGVLASTVWDWADVLLPDRAAEGARDVDVLFLALMGVSLFFMGLLAILILRFVIKYRAGSNADRSNPIRKTWKWEVTWTLIPTVIGLGLFVWSGFVFYRLTQPPDNARRIDVVGKQWMWKFQHPDGPEEINELHLPVGEPVRLVMQSQDVIHSLFVPAFRIKQDVLPGRYTSLWFTPSKTGSFHLFCAEYCGTDHSQMRGRVVVMTPADYEKWRSADALASPAPGEPGTTSGPLSVNGHSLFYQMGCNSCHLPSSRVRAPRLDGLYGRNVRLANGQNIVADEQYIRESILEPNAKICAGYVEPSLMPTYQGLVTDEELAELVKFVRSLQDGWPEETNP